MGFGTFSVDGLMSGLNTSDIIDQLLAIERGPVQRLQTQQSTKTNQLTALGAIRAQLLAVRTATAALMAPGGSTPRQASSSDESMVMVTASGTADLGTYQIVVHELAQAHKVRSEGQTSTSEALGLSGDVVINGETLRIGTSDTLLSLRNRINGLGAGVRASILSVSDTDHRLVLTSEQTGADYAIDLVEANEADLLESLGLVTGSTTVKHAVTDGAVSDLFSSSSSSVGGLLSLEGAPAATVQINGTDVAIDLATDSLQTIRDAINGAVSGVTATIVTEETESGNEYRLQIVGDSGTPTFTDADNVLVTLGVLQKGWAHELEQAQDARLDLDGVQVTRSSNSVTDLLTGVSLYLMEADSAKTVTVTVSGDLDAAEASVENLVNQYNELMGRLGDELRYDPETETSGTLFGNYSVVTLQSMLRRLVGVAIPASGNDPTLLSHIGITADERNMLVIDSSELRQALTENPAAVARLLEKTVQTTDPEISYVSSEATVQASPSEGYAVHIDQIATQATVLGNDLSGGLQQYEGLTFGDGVVVYLQAGTSVVEAVDAINEAFQQHGVEASAEVENNRIRITSDHYGSSNPLQISSTVGSGTPGSTGLGAEVAGEVATYSGQDVAGTINGEACTGQGRYLTGNEGNENTAGLRLRVAATSAGDHGVVHVTKGFASRLQDFIDYATDAQGGLVSNAETTIQDEIDALDERVTRMNEAIAASEARLRREFARLEETLARLQSQSDALMMQLQRLGIGRSSSGGLGVGT